MLVTRTGCCSVLKPCISHCPVTYCHLPHFGQFLPRETRHWLGWSKVTCVGHVQFTMIAAVRRTTADEDDGPGFEYLKYVEIEVRFVLWRYSVAMSSQEMSP